LCRTDNPQISKYNQILISTPLVKKVLVAKQPGLFWQGHKDLNCTIEFFSSVFQPFLTVHFKNPNFSFRYLHLQPRLTIPVRVMIRVNFLQAAWMVYAV